MKQIIVYKTSDNEIFEYKVEAEAHENKLDYEKVITKIERVIEKEGYLLDGSGFVIYKCWDALKKLMDNLSEVSND